MASGAADLSVKFWNLTSGELIRTIDQFSHWIIHLVLLDESQHNIQRFEHKSILITMTKDNLSLFSWDKNIPTIPDFVIPLNPADCFVWKKVFFTPGMQLFGEKLAFVRQVAMFDTHTVGMDLFNMNSL